MKKENMEHCTCGCQSPTNVVNNLEWGAYQRPEGRNEVVGCSCSGFQGQDALVDFVRLLLEENRKLRKQCEEMRSFIKRISTQKPVNSDTGKEFYNDEADAWKQKYESEKFQRSEVARKFKNLKTKIKKMIEIKATLEQQQKDASTSHHSNNDMNILHCNNNFPQDKSLEKNSLDSTAKYAADLNNSELSSSSFSSKFDFIEQLNVGEKFQNIKKIPKSVSFNGRRKHTSRNSHHNDKIFYKDAFNNYFFKNCRSYTNFDSVFLDNEMFSAPVLVSRFAS